MMSFNCANWPAPDNINALSTTRLAGISQEPYNSNNLAMHVGDDAVCVQKNRQLLVNALKLPQEPYWLNQTHSTHCIIAEKDKTRDADAIITQSNQYPLVILTADCLPITLCSLSGNEIAAIHAGWKGLLHGIVENTLAKMHNESRNLMAWIGPAICGNCYEVSEEMHLAFTIKLSDTKAAFKPSQKKWRANLPKIAEIILQLNGVEAVYQSNICTFELKNELFSYRRQEKTGRIATLIWFNKQQDL